MNFLMILFLAFFVLLFALLISVKKTWGSGQYEKKFLGKEKKDFIYIEEHSRQYSNDNIKVALEKSNVEKNKYGNVIPFDDTRVTLKNDDSFYINGNILSLPHSPYEYIATQWPIFSNLDAFWEMCLEKNVKVIVSLQKINNQKGCYEFWEDTDHFSINVLKEDFIGKGKKNDSSICEERRIRIKRIDDNREIELIQLHYTEWPDFGVPKTKDHFIKFIHYLEKVNQREKAKTIVIHCNAGIGRTGVLVGIHHLYTSGFSAIFNIRDLLLLMRTKRWGLVQTSEQYQFLTECAFLSYKQSNVLRRIFFKYLRQYFEKV